MAPSYAQFHPQILLKSRNLCRQIVRNGSFPLFLPFSFPTSSFGPPGGTIIRPPPVSENPGSSLNEDGKTYVLEDGPNYKLRHTCPLEEPAWATPAIAHGSLFVRTYSKLYRIEEAKK